MSRLEDERVKQTAQIYACARSETRAAQLIEYNMADWKRAKALCHSCGDPAGVGPENHRKELETASGGQRDFKPLRLLLEIFADC